jgi:hypothetical protein
MQLTLHLPSLGAACSIAPEAPPTPILDTLLSRADRACAPANGSWIARAFGFADPLPVARLMARRDNIDPGGDDLMFAEPVHMVADRDTVRLFPGRHLELEPLEVAAMTGALDEYFADLGLRFSASAAGRLYVHFARAERPTTHAMDAAVAMPLLDAQPVSHGALKWHAIQSEVQMLLHNHAVNRLREKYGKPLVSGVWFWGEGDMAAPIAPASFDFVTADAELVLQLARERGIRTGATDWSRIGKARVLVHLCAMENAIRAGDAVQLGQQLAALESGWIPQIDNGLNNGNIESLVLVTESSGQRDTFTLSSTQRRLRLWRRSRPLVDHFAAATDDA